MPRTPEEEAEYQALKARASPSVSRRTPAEPSVSRRTPAEEAEYRALKAKSKAGAPKQDEDSGITALDALGAITTAGKYFPPTAPAFLLGDLLGSRAGARGAAQGATAGFGDEIAGAVQAISQHPLGRYLPSVFIARKLADLTSGVPASQRAAAAEVDAEREARLGSDFGSNYQAARDAERRANEAAKAESPLKYGAGQVAGALPAAIATGGKSLPALLASGTGIGALTGAGTSEAKTGGELALDTAIGGGVGLGTALGGAALGKALPVAARALKRLGVDAARRVLTQGTKGISQARAVSPEAAEWAIQRGAVRPLGTSTGAAERLIPMRAQSGEAYGDLVEALQRRGVAGPEGGPRGLAGELIDEAYRRWAGGNIGRGPTILREAGERVAQLPPKLGRRLSLKQTESIKRALQDEAFDAYRQTGISGGRLGAQAQMDAAKMVRQATEDAIEAQAAKAPDLAKQFIPVKREAAMAIEASDAAESALNSLRNRGPVGLRDLLFAGLAGKTPWGKLVAVPLSMAARAVGPSTLATGAYGAGGALQALAPGASPLARALLPLLLQKEEEETP